MHLTRSRGRVCRARALVAGALVAVLALGARPPLAHADRIDDLCATVEHEKDEKARIAAVVSLGRLADRRAVPCLIKALGDKSPVVRGVAASALGHIGDPRAIPALERALNDSNEGVRTRARDALGVLREKEARAKGAGPGSRPVSSEKPVVVTPKERPRLDGGASEPSPRVHLVVKSTANKTKTGGAAMGKKLGELLVGELRSSPEVTLDEKAASTGSLQTFVIDGAIVDMSKTTHGGVIELRCEVRISISTGKGRMLSIVTGSAVVSVPKASYKVKDETLYWTTALENAVRGANQNLIGYVTKQVALR